jgi:hypothetical protein
MQVFSTTRTTFGTANTLWYTVSSPLLPFIPSLSNTQDWGDVAKSAGVVVHADRGYGFQRRVPQFLVRGPFNSWGFDKGVTSQMQ